MREQPERLWARVLLATALLACTSSPAGWELDSLLKRHPAVDQVRGHRLAEALPYFALAGDGLSLFLCRWDVEAPVAVWLPEDASHEEIAILERALGAWQGAGLGVRFEARGWRGEPPGSGVVFEILELARSAVAPTGTTIADCAIPVEVSADGDDPGPPIEVELHYASIQLHRSRSDLLGRRVPLSETELLGAAVHELGHALGISGHLTGSGSVMSGHGQKDAARRWGRRLEAGETLESPTLVALYAAPNGVRVGWLPLTRSQLAPLRVVAATASRMGLRGPYVRVGDESARWLWRDHRGNSVAVVVLEWPAVLHDPTRLTARLNRRARLLVETAVGR